jgi:Protein of unknown function (DUF3349)
MSLLSRVRNIASFLRSGYPTDMPITGYVPLPALLPRRVSDDEITAIVWELIAHGRWPIDTADMGVQITCITEAMPLPNDIERVRRRLAETG